MALFAIQRNGFEDVADLIQQVVEDMVDHGFIVVYPSGYNPSSRIPQSENVFSIILEAGPDVDPLHANQPWRVGFNLWGARQACEMIVGTELQLKNNGSFSFITASSGYSVGRAGCVGALFDKYMDYNNPDIGFINRTRRLHATIKNYANEVVDDPNIDPNDNTSSADYAQWPKTGGVGDGGAYPMNYRLTITDRGFFLGVFEGNWASFIDQSLIIDNKDNFFNWVLVQRPVDKNTGDTYVVGKSPVFCVNSVNNKYWKFIVRESDIPHPTVPVRAEYHSEDNFRLINPDEQISITEDKKYTVSFIHNLNTPRFRYSQELDLIAMVSSDIIMESVNVPVSAYGSTRIYTSMPCNKPFNTGVKILVLTSETP